MYVGGRKVMCAEVGRETSRRWRSPVPTQGVGWDVWVVDLRTSAVRPRMIDPPLRTYKSADFKILELAAGGREVNFRAPQPRRDRF